MPRMRTIKEAIRHIKDADPDTAFTEHALRGMVNTGRIPHITAGRKILLDIDGLDEFLRGEREEAPKSIQEPLTPARARILTAQRRL